jgi:hypothetical protein
VIAQASLVLTLIASAPDLGSRVGKAAPPLDPSRSGPSGSHAVEVTRGCAGGCARAHLPDEKLAAEQIEPLLAAIAKQAPGEPSLQLDTLLFHGAKVAEYIDAYGHAPLTDAQARFLDAELAKKHAMLEIRLIDDQGAERARLDPTRVPLGIHFDLELSRAQDLQPPRVTGTLARVGVDYVWSRF